MKVCTTCGINPARKWSTTCNTCKSREQRAKLRQLAVEDGRYGKCKSCGVNLTFRVNKFCSHKCAGQQDMADNRVFFKCAHCKKDASRIKADAKRKKGNKLFCSYKCNWDYLREHPVRSLGTDGYIHIKRSREHRVLMESLIKSKLPTGIHVHHINGNKADNRPENLQLLTASDHRKLHQRKS